MSLLRNLDWRVLFFAFLACYVLPWPLFGAVFYSDIADEGAISGLREVVLEVYFYLHFLAMPLAAGYFTARYAKNRPQLHVLLVVLLGTCASMLARPDSLAVQAVVGLVSLLMASLGAFVVLRGARR